jgi:hypothetical protein
LKTFPSPILEPARGESADGPRCPTRFESKLTSSALVGNKKTLFQLLGASKKIIGVSMQLIYSVPLARKLVLASCANEFLLTSG